MSLGNSSAPLRMCRLTPEFLMNYTLCPCWSRHKNLSSSSVSNLKPRAIWILAGRVVAKLTLNPLRYLRREMQFQRQVKLCCQLKYTSQKLKKYIYISMYFKKRCNLETYMKYMYIFFFTKKGTILSHPCVCSPSKYLSHRQIWQSPSWSSLNS